MSPKTMLFIQTIVLGVDNDDPNCARFSGSLDLLHKGRTASFAKHDVVFDGIPILDFTVCRKGYRINNTYFCAGRSRALPEA